MIEELIQKVFTTRNLVHLEHWRTKNYAEHMALGDLYDQLIDSIDGIVEAYQGQFGLVDVSGAPELKPPAEIVPHLQEELDWIATNRSRIAKSVASIENLVDELSAQYQTALYKLRFLS